MQLQFSIIPYNCHVSSVSGKYKSWFYYDVHGTCSQNLMAIRLKFFLCSDFKSDNVVHILYAYCKINIICLVDSCIFTSYNEITKSICCSIFGAVDTFQLLRLVHKHSICSRYKFFMLLWTQHTITAFTKIKPGSYGELVSKVRECWSITGTMSPFRQ